jgi:uncharacterized membrane protein
MQPMLRSGRYLFSLAIIGFGLVQFVSGNFMSTFLPVHEGLPGRTFFLYFTSTVFVAAGAALWLNRFAMRAALLLGFLFGLFFIYPHLVLLIPDLHNGGEWAVAFEVFAFCGGSLILAGFPDSGRWIFAIALLVFGIQHFIYMDYIVTLIPAWIPFPVFWTWVVRLAFLLAAISICIKVKTRLACTLLGFMFLFWVIFVHAPRVIASPRLEPEWTSLFVALGICGIFFMLGAGMMEKGENPE